MIIWHVETSSGPRFDWANDEEHLRRQLIEYNNDVLNDDDEDEQLADDATLDEAIEKIEERENFSQEDFPLPKVFAAVLDTDGGTLTSVHLSYRKAIEWAATEAGVELDHIAHLSDEDAQQKIADSLEGCDWLLIHEEEIQP